MPIPRGRRALRIYFPRDPPGAQKPHHPLAGPPRPWAQRVHDPLTRAVPGWRRHEMAPSRDGAITTCSTSQTSQPTALAGPIGATLYATSTTPDTEWVVQLSDVAPDGSAKPLTSGLLEGNQRALDRALSWYAPDGRPLLPYHPYTKATQAPVPTGKIVRYDVEVFPTFDTLQPGHRLRVTVATSDFPHALPTLTQGPGLIGGVYQVEHTPAHPSSVELPLITDLGSLASGS